MTQLTGAITIEGRKLEEAIAAEVHRQVAAATSEAVRPVLDEVRRLAALAEAQIVGASEAAKILVSAGATLEIGQAVHLVANLARMGYRFTLVDPEAVTQEMPQVAPKDNGFGHRPVPWTEGAPHPEACSCVHCAIGRDPLLPDDQDTSWTAKFE
jgi:hypothetical protein